MAKIDDSVKKKVPELRFKGFTDEWKERKLKDIAQFNPKTVLPDEFEYVDLESVVGTEMISHRTESKDQAPSRAQRLAQKGDVFYQTVRPYQMNNYLYDLPYDNYVFSTGYAQMRPSIDSYFLLNSVQNKQFVQHVLDRSTGTSYPAINSSDLSNIEIHVPSKLSEQQKIGSFFKQLDDTIALHQRKLDLLKEQKKGYLQKMFPKNGAKVPELRFAGFADDWEERKLADVVSISAGGDVDKTKLIEDGGYPVLANALTNSGIVGYYDSYKVEAPAVTVTGRGDVGHAVARHVNFTPVVRLLSLKSEVLDADFLANMLNQTNILVESTGVPQLTAPQLGSYKILYPNLNEQTKIGKLLNAFDNLIALHQRKLDLLKETKKGFLQKMFV